VCDLIPLAGPTATVIAAVAAVVVTWRLGQSQIAIGRQQADTAKQQAELASVRLQHDLFDRRFAVYEATQKLLVEVLETSKVSREVYDAFARNTGKSVFLFDRELDDYLSEIRGKAMNLHLTSLRLADETLPVGEERTRLARERADLSTWFVEQFHVLIEKFKPSLALDKRQL
jgi:hypothetical protein